MCMCVCVCTCRNNGQVDSYPMLWTLVITQNVRKKRRELQRACDAASKGAVDTRSEEDKTDHTPLHSHSAIELHRSPTNHVKLQTLKSSSATNLAAATIGVTMTRPPPAVSSAGLRSHLPHRMREISINKVLSLY